MENINWVSPLTIVGPPAEGNRYYRRQYINDELWEQITKGAHVLFVAPRRVGKSSVMKDVVAEGKEGYLCIFENIQSVDSKSWFYRRLYFLILNQLGAFKKINKILTKWLKSKGIDEINWEGGIKFKDIELNYKDELLSLISKLPEFDKKVVLFLDEFSEVIFRIKDKENADSAIDVLHTMREIRSIKAFDHCYFVLAGSVGLDHIVESMDRLTLINDLYPLKISALSTKEMKEFVDQITKDATMKISEHELNHIENKINHLIPYFIQLIINECDKNLRAQNRAQLTSDDIDTAFDYIIKTEKNFNDWEDRLRPNYLSLDEYRFCKAILTKTAHKDSIALLEVFNLSIKHNCQDDYMNLLKMLVHDGYLHEDRNNFYRFVSPMLQSWWKNQHPSFEIEK